MKMFTTLIIPEEKKKGQLVHSLAQALTLTLTLTLSHLANKAQRTTSTLFGLMYLILSSTTDYKYHMWIDLVRAYIRAG